MMDNAALTGVHMPKPNLREVPGDVEEFTGRLGLPPPVAFPIPGPGAYGNADACDARPPEERRIKASELIDSLLKDRLFPYLIKEGQEDDFCKLYDAQAMLNEQGHEIDACMFIARYWLEDCWNNHIEHHASAKDLESIYPHRLIDLGEPSHLNESFNGPALPREIKVIEVAREQKPQYIAVSYRWPKKPNQDQQLTSATRDHFFRGYSTEALPQLYCDAFTVARMLGFRYVWIDALCIMQDNGGDWHAEAPKMASVYGNAIFTVAFGDCPESKLSDDAEIWRSCSLRDAATRAAAQPFIKGGKIPIFDKRNPESIYYWLESNGNFPARPSSELDERGWTFQERLLSKRVLTITTDGLFWDCCRSSASDTRLLGFLGDFSPRFRDSDERKIKTQLLGMNRDTITVARRDLYLLWRRILQDYTQRKFTHSKDRIVAIEGVVQRIGAVLNEPCFLGVWKGDSLRSLIWFCDTVALSAKPASNALDVLPARKDYQVSVPSWSWASVSFPIHYRLWHPFETSADHNVELTSPCATLLHISAQPIDKRSFANYVGVVTLHGTLARVPASLLTGPGCKVILDPRPPQDFPGYSKYKQDELDSKANSKKKGQREPPAWRTLLAWERDEIYVLPVLKGGYSKTLQAQYCLILDPRSTVEYHIERENQCEILTPRTTKDTDYQGCLIL
ncbi:HET domain-containing protein [Fusarium sp. LHS14.1]|nr:HET domain-containing protein [Fusarium sp. LHS14.1]